MSELGDHGSLCKGELGLCKLLGQQQAGGRERMIVHREAQDREDERKNRISLCAYLDEIHERLR